jgi:cytochrome P450
LKVVSFSILADETKALSNLTQAPIHRQALQDFRFSDGYTVRKGSWVCVPYQAMTTDEKYYSDAKSFDGRRFLRKGDNETNHHGFASQSESWLLFGSGRITW